MPLIDVEAVILGGGRGTRLYPLTRDRTKPAVPIGGKYRLIDIPCSNCINSGINRIFVLTQFLSASLHRHIAQTYRFGLFTNGFVDLLPAEQTLTSTDWYQGTADAVRRQLVHLSSRRPKDVVILAGDHLYRMDYRKFVDFHRQSRADVTIGVLPVKAEDCDRFGILKTNAEGRITRFSEKPSTPDAQEGLASRPGTDRPYLGSMGIYVFRYETLVRLLESPDGDDFGKHIIPRAIDHDRVFAYPFTGYWEDIGTISAFYDVNIALTRSHRPFDFHDLTHPIYTRPRFLPPTQVDDARLRNVILAEGGEIYGADVEESVIGLRSIIQKRTVLKQVVMMGADYYEEEDELSENRRLARPNVGIGAETRITRAIIDKGARIGRNVTILSHEGEPDWTSDNVVIRDGIVVIPKNAIIPDGTTI